MTEENSQKSARPEMRPPKQETESSPRRTEARSIRFWTGLALSAAGVLVGGALVLAVLFTVEYRRFNTLVLGILLFVLGAIGLTVCLRHLSRKEPEGRRKSRVALEMRDLPLGDERTVEAVVPHARGAASSQDSRSPVGQGRKEEALWKRPAFVLIMSVLALLMAGLCIVAGNYLKPYDLFYLLGYLAIGAGLILLVLGGLGLVYGLGCLAVARRILPRWLPPLLVGASVALLGLLAVLYLMAPIGTSHLRLQQTLGKHRFAKARLQGADLSGVDLSEAWLADADLSGADLSGADLSGAYLFDADLSGADLSGVDLREAELDRADLRGAELDDQTKIGDKWRLVREIATQGGRNQNLAGADLSRAYLREVDLSGADLSGADLTGTDLSKANLSGADLTEARLNYANLRAANLAKATLSRASLHGADLSKAQVSDAQLAQAASLKGASMPDGSRHE